jgi:hypothetical protein
LSLPSHLDCRAALFHGDEEETVTQVNTEAKSDDACKLISIAYLRGKDVSKAVTKEVVGFVTPQGVGNVPHFVLVLDRIEFGPGRVAVSA